MVIDDNFYLSLALDEAWKYQGLTYPNPSVGCVIVDKNGKLLSVEAHQKAGCAHAELRAVKSALKKINPHLNFPENANELHHFIIKNHNNFLRDACVYVTLEPCSHKGKTPSCAYLLKSLHVKKVFIGIRDTHKKAKGGADILQDAKIIVEFSSKFSSIREKCNELIEPFLAWQKGHFSFF